jgi:hypothetical protein
MAESFFSRRRQYPTAEQNRKADEVRYERKLRRHQSFVANAITKRPMNMPAILPQPSDNPKFGERGCRAADGQSLCIAVLPDPAKMIAVTSGEATMALKPMNWLIQNREWLFGGVLVAVPLAVVGWILAKRHSVKSQKQVGGDNSVNVQVGGNIQIGRGERDDRPNPKRRG